jgi:ribonucleoside-diphosphate reductase alpha chain
LLITVRKSEVAMTSVIEIQRQKTTPPSLPEVVATLTRDRLPDTRESVTHKFSISGHEGYITVGLYEDGRPGEVFIKMAKEGSTMSGLMETIGILTSLAMQHGVPVDSLVRKLENMRFEPSGWTPNSAIREASSVVDYVFRWLGIAFARQPNEEGGP